MVTCIAPPMWIRALSRKGRIQVPPGILAKTLFSPAVGAMTHIYLSELRSALLSNSSQPDQVVSRM